MPSAPAIEIRGVRKRCGEVTAVDGVDLAVAPGESKQARMALGVVPQLDNLDVELTCRQILTVFARLYRVPRAERAAAG
jgi:ABC-type multidrug transport system ATPase subunit